MRWVRRQRADRQSAVEEPESGLQGERGIAPVNAASTQRQGKALLLLLALAAMLATVYLMPSPRPPADPNAVATGPEDANKAAFDETPPQSLGASRITPGPPQLPVFTPPPMPKIEPAHPPASANGDPAEPRTLTPEERRMAGGVDAMKRNEQSRAQRAVPPVRAGNEAASAGNNGYGLTSSSVAFDPPRTGEANAATTRVAPMRRTASRETGSEERSGRGDRHSLAGQLETTTLEGVRASQLPSMTFMVARGRLFECILDTAISTMVAGQTRCTTPHDVYGEDGKVVLLDGGTEIIGEHRSDLRGGQRRLGVVWVRAKTPRGVLIDLRSPASDPLGRAGVDGNVDTHFWERFGAAIMLSVLDDALAAAVNQRSGDTYYFGNTERQAKRTAEIALENSINLPPTLVKNQGESVAIFLARDLDFRDVYDYRQLGVR